MSVPITAARRARASTAALTLAFCASVFCTFVFCAQAAAAPGKERSLQLAQAGVPTEAHVSVMVLEPTTTAASDKSIAVAVSGLVPVELATVKAFEVLAAADVKQMIEFEAEKQAIGCTDNSCLAELAGALGADLVIFGDVSRLGTLIIVNLNLFDSVKTRAVGRVSIQTKAVEDLPEKLGPAMQLLVKPYLLKHKLPLPEQWKSAADQPSLATGQALAEPSDDENQASINASSNATQASDNNTSSSATIRDDSGATDDQASTSEGADIMSFLPWALAGGGGAVAGLGLFVAGLSLAIPPFAIPVVVQSAKDANIDGDFATWQLMSALHTLFYVIFYGGGALGALVVAGGGVLAVTGVGWGVVGLME